MGRHDNGGYRNAKPGDTELQTYCWCMRKLVMVPVEEIAACRTATCGLDDCGPRHPNAQPRWAHR